MSVIVNDFEIVMEPRARPAAERALPPEQPPASLITPQDIQNIIRHQVERAARIHAH